MLRQLGEGACGRVFHAHHKTLNISVALKLLQPALVSDPRVHSQLKHEAQLLARLNHPHIVRVWDFEDDPACPYIVMEYIEGPSLADLIGQSGRLAPDRALHLMRRGGTGTERGVEASIIHRDLKPANVLLTREGEAKLSDLGLAVVLGSSPDPSRPAAAGPPLYAAPEPCFAPEKVDQRSDLYSLGATFYHALTGEPPFTGQSVGEVMHRHACEMPDSSAPAASPACRKRCRPSSSDSSRRNPPTATATTTTCSPSSTAGRVARGRRATACPANRRRPTREHRRGDADAGVPRAG